MFKRSEEVEWNRFSRALSGKEKEKASEGDDNAAPLASATEAAGDLSSAPAAPRAISDVNLTLSRSSRSAAGYDGQAGESLIGEHTFVDGTYRAEESIRVRGTVQGELESKQNILIEEQARVTAKVTAATSIVVSGQVNGQLCCSGRVEIKPTGRVTGEITAGTLIMQEGAFFEGHLKMGEKASNAVAGQAPAGV